MSMTLTILILFSLVLTITLFGFLLTEVVFAKSPGWQDFTCKVTLTGTLLVPLAFLVATTWIPNGLIDLPVLNPIRTSNESIAAVVSKDETKSELDASPSNSQNENPTQSKAGSPVATNEPAKNATSKSGKISRDREPFGGAKIKSGINDATKSEATADRQLDAAIPDKRSMAGWMAFIGGSIWATGSCLLFGYFAIGWIGLRRVRRSSSELNSTKWNEVGLRLALEMKLTKPLLIAASHNVSTPMVAGIRKPIVLIPDSLVQPSSHVTHCQKEIESILGHEAMHVMRSDTTWNLLSCLTFVLWWPVPTLHLMRRRMGWVRELLCDANAVKRVGVADYADTLLQMATSPTKRKLGVLSLSMQPSAKALEARIGWILDRSASVAGMPRGLVQRSVWCLLGLLLLVSTTVKLVPGNYFIPVSDKVAAQEESIHVRGTVSNDGTPVTDAIVYLVTVSEKGYWPLPVPHVTAKTNEQGQFDFQEVEEGSYMLWAEGDGLTSLEKFLKGKRMTVGRDSEPEAVELALVEGCNYRVSVLSAADNSPIENAEISFEWTDTERTYRTDSSGIANIKGLAPNTWYFVIRADGFATTFSKTAVQEVGSNAELKFALGPGGSIVGTVTDQYGDPVADAEIYCLSDELTMAPAFAEVETNMAGEYRLEGIPLDHKLRISSSADGYKHVQNKTSIEELGTEVDLVVEKLPYGGDVVVTVLDEVGTPVRGAELLNRGSASSDVRKAVTDGEGRARLANMYNYEGDHYVVIRAKGRVPTVITVKPGTEAEPATEEVKLAKGRTLRGQVVTPEGEPAAYVSVFLRETFRLDWASGTDLKWPRILTDAEGKFELNEMEGDTSLTIYTPKEYAPIEDYEVNLDGDVTEITIEMSKAASLRIRAVDSETGDSIPAFNVKLGRVEDFNRIDGDVPTQGINSSMVNPGINIHGTTKEFVLDGQAVNVVYSLTVSADGYETVEVTRIRATIDPDLFDVSLTKKE